MSEAKEYLTTSKAAKLLNYTEEQVRNLCQTGDLTGAEQDYDGAPWRIPLEAVEDRLRQHRPEKLPFYKRPLFWNMKKLYGVIIAILTFLALLFGPLADSGVRDWVYQQFRGRPFDPANENEALIVIATFYRTEGVVDVAVHDEIRRAIQEKIDDLNLENVHVAVEPTIIETNDRNEAEELGNKYNATLIIWGNDTGVRVEVNFLNLKNRDFDISETTISEIEKTQLASPEEYSLFIVDELPSQLSYLSLIALGQGEANKGDYQQAITLFETALASLSSSSIENSAYLEVGATYFSLGTLYQITNQNSLAIEKYYQAQAYLPEYFGVYNNRSISYLYQNETEKALEDINYGITLNSNEFPLFHNRGIIYAQLEEYELAILDFNRAIEINPANKTTYIARGLAYQNLGEYEFAIHNFNLAGELDSEHAEVYSLRGNTYALMGQYEKSIADYDRAIALNNNNAMFYFQRGLALFFLGKGEQAIGDYKLAINLDRENDLFYEQLGIAYDSLKDYEQAIANFEKAIELNPENSSVYTSLGFTYIDLEEYEKAIINFNKAIELNPSEDLFDIQGQVFSLSGNYEQAVSSFDQAIALNANNASLYVNRGKAYSEIGEYELAISDFDLAISLNSRLSSAIYHRGNAYAFLKNYNQALADFNQASTLNPSNLLPYLGRVNIYIEQNQISLALDELYTYLERNPSSQARQKIETIINHLEAGLEE